MISEDMYEKLQKLTPIEHSKKALEMFITVKTPEEKKDWADEYEEGRAGWTSENWDLKLEESAIILFTQEIIKTDNDKLKKGLAAEISLNARYDDDKENTFCMNAVSILFSVAKTTSDEEVANDIYSQARFMLGEGNNIRLKANEAQILGMSLLNNMNPAMKDQRAQADLLDQFNEISGSYHSEAVPFIAGKASELLKEYNANTVEDIAAESSKKDKEICWAQHFIRAELAKLALSS